MLERAGVVKVVRTRKLRGQLGARLQAPVALFHPAPRERVEGGARRPQTCGGCRPGSGGCGLRLDTLAVDQPAAWQRADELIATKKPRDYDAAVQLLVDLRDLAERDGDSGLFRNRLAEPRAVHARKPSLLERLNRAGLDT
ncbi:hypothetical protein ACGFJ5_02100 [Micromonospora echinaurantiaca]|uniref:hypothetical protein n=1 Tax=Micromonospora echinaurantiaca TaxID=47857 RepID=UPI0037105953